MEKFKIPIISELLRSKAEAQNIAQEIAEAGKLQVDASNITTRKDKVREYDSIYVFTSKRGWWVDIRPEHFGGRDSSVFDLKQLRYITFKYCAEGVIKGHANKSSTYLKIASVD